MFVFVTKTFLEVSNYLRLKSYLLLGIAIAGFLFCLSKMNSIFSIQDKENEKTLLGAQILIAICVLGIAIAMKNLISIL